MKLDDVRHEYANEVRRIADRIETGVVAHSVQAATYSGRIIVVHLPKSYPLASASEHTSKKENP